jgi:hypothetical protein
VVTTCAVIGLGIGASTTAGSESSVMVDTLTAANQGLRRGCLFSRRPTSRPQRLSPGCYPLAIIAHVDQGRTTQADAFKAHLHYSSVRET